MSTTCFHPKKLTWESAPEFAHPFSQCIFGKYRIYEIMTGPLRGLFYVELQLELLSLWRSSTFYKTVPLAQAGCQEHYDALYASGGEPASNKT